MGSSAADAAARRRRRRNGEICGSDSAGTAVEQVVCTSDDKLRRRGRKDVGLVGYEDLPEYMKENEYILGHYRSEWPISRAAMSFFSLHNESLNVWTHFVGFVVFLALTLLHLSDDVPNVADLLSGWRITSAANAVENSSWNQQGFLEGSSPTINYQSLASSSSASAPPRASRWPFFVFLGGAMFCLLTSTSCHLLCCHSRRLNLFLARLDYAGIAVMIVVSFFPPIYYAFQCQPHWQILYLSGILALGLLTVAALLSPHLTAGAFRGYRALLFVSMGLSGIVPAVHATAANWDEPRRPITVAYEVAMAVLYLIGTVFYVSRVPERWRPGAFDLAGHSHQIFHVFVVAGALAHYAAALVFLEWRDSMGCHLLPSS